MKEMIVDAVEHPAVAPTTVHEYLKHMKAKAAHNIAKACACKFVPETEEEVKKMLAHANKHGDCHERAEVEYEVGEFIWACNTLMMMEKFPDFAK